MKKKKIANNKHVFWQALIVAFIIFWTGLMLGILFEDGRVNKLENFYFDAETDIFDIQLKGELLNMFQFDCKISYDENIKFADRIFWQARDLEKYDASTRITSDIVLLHKRYDLLRVMLWKNLIELDERCDNNKGNVVVYLYQYDKPNVNTKAKQGTISKVLIDLKNKYGDEVILVPIAYDTNVASLDLLIEEFEIDEFPAVIVNQENEVKGTISVESIEKYLSF